MLCVAPSGGVGNTVVVEGGNPGVVGDEVGVWVLVVVLIVLTGVPVLGPSVDDSHELVLIEVSVPG